MEYADLWLGLHEEVTSTLSLSHCRMMYSAPGQPPPGGQYGAPPPPSGGQFGAPPKGGQFGFQPPPPPTHQVRTNIKTWVGMVSTCCLFPDGRHVDTGRGYAPSVWGSTSISATSGPTAKCWPPTPKYSTSSCGILYSDFYHPSGVRSRVS